MESDLDEGLSTGPGGLRCSWEVTISFQPFVIFFADFCCYCSKVLFPENFSLQAKGSSLQGLLGRRLSWWNYGRRSGNEAQSGKWAFYPRWPCRSWQWALPLSNRGLACWGCRTLLRLPAVVGTNAQHLAGGSPRSSPLRCNCSHSCLPSLRLTVSLWLPMPALA